MQSAKKFELHQQTLWLSPGRCIYWEEKNTLILSDTHFGKTGHFRKNGISVPQNVYIEDLYRLIDHVQYFAPQKLVIVGDMFHSHSNKEMDLFLRRRMDLKQLKIDLVKGNHDILHEDFYSQAEINVINGQLNMAPFGFVHDIADANTGIAPYYFSGHIHPGISLKGLGKQSLKFACFYFGKQFAILPAFGKFTGSSSIKIEKGDNIFAIMPEDFKNNQPAKIFKV